MAEDYDSSNRHLQRDVHEAHTSAQVAKLLATLALIASIIALAVAILAYNKAGEAQSTANRATERVTTSAIQ